MSLGTAGRKIQLQWLAGGGLADTIVEAIDNSRKVILLITPAFTESQWCDFEMNMALVNKMNDIIIIHKQPVYYCRKASRTLLALLKARLYLQWTDVEDGQNLFWGKLRDCLERATGQNWEVLGNTDL